MLLAYSRGALLAAAIGGRVLVRHRAAAPARRRGARSSAALGGAAIALWAFGQHALSDDRVALGVRESAGYSSASDRRRPARRAASPRLAVGFWAAERPPSVATRRQAGAAILVGLALMPVALAAALALSDRGFGGLDLAHLEHAHRRVGGAAGERPRPPHRRRQRARALLERGAEDLRRQPGQRRRRRRLRDRAPALPRGRARRAPRARLRRADRRRPRARRPRGVARAARRLAGGRPARDRPAGRACAGCPFTPERIGLLTMLAVVVLRRALARRLDVVRARQRAPRAAGGRVPRRARAARCARSRSSAP